MLPPLQEHHQRHDADVVLPAVAELMPPLALDCNVERQLCPVRDEMKGVRGVVIRSETLGMSARVAIESWGNTQSTY